MCPVPTLCCCPGVIILIPITEGYGPLPMMIGATASMWEVCHAAGKHMGKVVVEMAAEEPNQAAGQAGHPHTWPAIPGQQSAAAEEAPASGKPPAPAMPLAARPSFICR